MKGSVIGQYRVTDVLGEGGMGVVYAAEHTLLGRPAAVKLLLPELSRNQDIVQRFFNEARAATAIRHPGIVEIYDFGWTSDGAAFIVMELLQGETLRARRTRGSMAWSAALAVTRQIAGALGAAHAKGIVHRDLKPDNVFLVQDPEVPGGERIKLLDFGIAKLAGSGVGQHMTRTGTVMGTPTYMAPEQCRGVAIDSRADLYSLGCILFELCAGRPPFVGEGEGDVLAAHIHMPPPALGSLAHGVPKDVEALVHRMLAKAPLERVQTAEEVIRLIDAASAAVSSPRASTSFPPEASGMSLRAAVPAYSDTTLSSAAGSRNPASARPPRRRPLLFAATGGALAIAAAVVAIAASGDDDAPTTTTSVAYSDLGSGSANAEPAPPPSPPPPAAPEAQKPAPSPAASPSAPEAQKPAPSPAASPSAPEAPKAPPPSSAPPPPTSTPAAAVSTSAPAASPSPSAAPASAAPPSSTSATPPKKEPPPPAGASASSALSSSRPGSPPSSAPTTGPKPSAPTTPPSPPAVAKPRPEAPEAPAPTTVDVAIDSSPSGAEVVHNGKVIGKTPFRGALPRGRDVSLVLRLRGHANKAVTVRTNAASRQLVTLVPVAHDKGVNPFD